MIFRIAALFIAVAVVGVLLFAATADSVLRRKLEKLRNNEDHGGDKYTNTWPDGKRRAMPQSEHEKWKK